MSSSDVQTTASETATLSTRGYKLLKKMGEGSYAKVYLSEYKPVDAPIDSKKAILACKVIDTARAPKDFVRKFLPRELNILIKLNHPHIIHVHSIFQRKAKYFIFMRLAENGDLLDFILKHGAIAESQARVWLRQLALALQYMHTLELAHRDLKCENILITNNFNVKIADFGFARSVIDGSGKVLSSETYCGSLSYAAPEILRGQPYAPKVADIWSLGVVLFIMLNKAMPFDDTNIKRLFEQQNSRKWRFRAKVIDILSTEVKKLVTAMLEPDIKRRYRVEQIVTSEWLAMDLRLLKLSQAEQDAISTAEDQQRQRIEPEPRPLPKPPKPKEGFLFQEPHTMNKFSPYIQTIIQAFLDVVR
ncbi:testis-specific serine/threonine-protein kinase 1-like isoform X2 [Chrysoperla carnea]|uniref:testis-specific serine/threonine-protein kinase 1-like isoform X2 n=1 Tax=Chrysoperla carnea TaxID=189513 RepID=UPI001D0877A2|nr:testis-specific serine/threonine-protein kinase 1-like isoform X2 [Chrysoperla carnea]